MEVPKKVTTLLESVQEQVIELVERDGGLMNGHVPLGLISDKDVPVNRENLDLIGAQLDDESVHKGTDGQIQPIMLGLVTDPDNEPEYERLQIIDGFHRYRKFQMRGNPTIFATIIPVTKEELLDKRIQNTRNHQGLQFARATQWVIEAWGLNPLADRLTASQAFVLGRTKSSNGKRLGLNEDEVRTIKEWVDDKAGLWGLDPLTIYSYLNTASTVARELVHNSRPDAVQAVDLHSLNHSTLTRIGRQIPDRPALQQAVAKAISTHRLGGSGTTALLSDVKRMSDKEAIAYIEGVDFVAYKERIAQKQVYTYREDELLRLERIRDSSRVRPLSEITRLTVGLVELALVEGDYDPERMRVVATELGEIVASLEATVERINATAEGGQKTFQRMTPNKRSVEEFTLTLTEYLRDPSAPFHIETEREALSVERALSRGRGTPKSLENLKAIVERFYEQGQA